VAAKAIRPRRLTLPSTPGSVIPLKVVRLTRCKLRSKLKQQLASQFGPYNPVLYRVFFFRNNRYVELSTMADDGCERSTVLINTSIFGIV